MQYNTETENNTVLLLLYYNSSCFAPNNSINMLPVTVNNFSDFKLKMINLLTKSNTILT